MRPRIILMIGLISLFGLAQALGQSNRDTSKQGTILLDSTEVSIGMPRDVAISRLAQSFKLEKQENSDSWIVMAAQNEGNQTTYRAVGSVSFKDGKLEAVYKKWGPQDAHTDVDFARGIYGVIASLASRGKQTAELVLEETSNRLVRLSQRSSRVATNTSKWGIIRSAQHEEFSDVTEVLKARVK